MQVGLEPEAAAAAGEVLEHGALGAGDARHAERGRGVAGERVGVQRGSAACSSSIGRMITRASAAIASASYGSTTGAPERTAYSGEGPSTIWRIQTERPGPQLAWNASRSAPAGLASQLAPRGELRRPGDQAVDGAGARGGAPGHGVVRRGRAPLTAASLRRPSASQSSTAYQSS